MSEHYCPVCGSAGAAEGQTQNALAVAVECNRCGRYHTELRFLTGKEHRKEDPHYQQLVPYLSAHLRQASDSGEILKVDWSNWESFAEAHAHTSVSRKLDMLLQLFARHSTSIGKPIQLQTDDFVLIDAASNGELNYLINALVEQDVIRPEGPSGFHVVTAKGWERLTPMDPGGVPGTCFVAMAFDPLLDAAYENGIEPAIRATGLSVIRVDKVEHNGVVTDLIQAEIRRAQVTVADVTMQRAGVYFEAGLAIGLGRIVIWSCREDKIKDVHFDTRQYSHVVWKDIEDLRMKLERRIRGTVTIPIKQ